MSNTGQKGITYLRGQGVYKVTVGWRGKVVTRYVRGEHPKDLPKAIRVRNGIERKLSKPRTEEVVRSFGFAQGKAWRRPSRKRKAQGKRGA
jgi:hypothetical protein